MKVLVVGGTVLKREDSRYESHLSLVRKVGKVLGQAVVSRRHDLLICSPHKGSVDREAALGAAAILSGSRKALIEFHTPELEETQQELKRLTHSLPSHKFKVFRYPISADEGGCPNQTYTWLLSQFNAMSRAQVVLSFGGRVDGAASLLLPIAESQRKSVLPLTFLGGAAAQSFERQRNELTVRLGDDISLLQDKRYLKQAVSLIDSLPNRYLPGAERSEPIRVFVSYPTHRKIDADAVELLLTQYGCEVYRDRVNFEAGRSIQGEIREYIHRANIFVAIWCQEYACSPWCFDEIEIALIRHKDHRMIPWILCFDKTPIIPRDARDLPFYEITSRIELEETLLKLLKQARGMQSREEGL
jgi:hypothetical protein